MAEEKCRALVVSRRGALSAVKVARARQLPLVPVKLVKIWSGVDGSIHRFAVGGITRDSQKAIIHKLSSDCGAAMVRIQPGGSVTAAALAGARELSSE